MTDKIIFVTAVGGDVACSVLRCLVDMKDGSRIIGCDINCFAQGKMYVDEFVVAQGYADVNAYKNFIVNT